MKSLIIGRGFGQLYEAQLPWGTVVDTVDPDPNRTATYKDLSEVPADASYTTAHICTPNFLHEQHAKFAAKHAEIIFVEKPGVVNAKAWSNMASDFHNIRFYMTKNNMFREQIPLFRDIARTAKTINLFWNNKNRVPNPGTWFTTKELAFGGVSRDLMPHLLSWIPALFPNDWHDVHSISKTVQQRWNLKDLTGSDYGSIKTDGVYNVDDYAQMQFLHKGKLINLVSNWRTQTGPEDTLTKDKRCVEFIFADGTMLTYDFGLCPEYAYRKMIKTCLDNRTSAEFWSENLEIDLWIHEMLEHFNG